MEFASAQSVFAVCPYCQSSIVRNGDVLERLGKMAEVFNDYSPLKLGQTGQLPAAKGGKPEGFRLVGRLQYKGEAGAWNEWQALTDSNEIAVISEDNGQFVLSRASNLPAKNLPDENRWRPGQSVAISGQQYSVASVVLAELAAVCAILVGSGAQIEGGCAAAFVGIHLHDQRVVLHVETKTATGLAIVFCVDHPGACLWHESLCQTSAQQRTHQNDLLEHVNLLPINKGMH